MAANKQSPLANRSEFINFPVDEYVSACIISYQVASLPPSKFSKSTDPVPSVRFLLAGRVKNTEGEDVVVRKWTSWMTLSYNDKSKMAQMFKDVPDLESLITDDGEGGALWETPFKIMLEKSKDGKYSNIIRIKVSDDKSVLDICYTGKSKLPDGTETFAPYKKVGAYGKLVYLEVAVNKEKDGAKFYSGEDLIDNPNETDDD